MIVHQIRDLSNTKVIDFLKKSLANTAPGLENYHPDFSNHSGNLFYLLKTDRYKTGNYFVLENGGKYLGSAGWNEFQDVALVLTRAFVPPEFRNQYVMAETLIPLIFDQTAAYEKLWITCNEYNIAIYKAFKRMHEGKSSGLFSSWPSVYRNFVPIGKKIVNYTDQYVVEYKRNIHGQ